MANLVQLADELEYVPKEQLVQMSQDPNNRFPQFLVLSEIQRRTQNENAYRASQTKPTTTVAEEVVSEFARPKSLQAGMPSESAPTDAFSSESMGMPASAPMQQPMQPPMAMASGGLTSFQTGDRTALEESLQNSYFTNALQNYMMNNAAVSTALGTYETGRELKDYIEDESSDSNMLPKIGGGLLIAAGLVPQLKRFKQAKELYQKKVKPFFKNRYGTVPAGPSQTVPTGVGAPFTVGSKTYNPGQVTIAGSPRISALRNTLSRPEARGALRLAPITAGAYFMSGYDPETGEKQDESKLTQAQQDYVNLVKQNQLAALQVDDKPKKGLGAFSPTDLIQLGGAIMSARNISELGAGISGMAGMSAQRKADAEEAEILGRLREAQISQLETETALLPDKQLADEIEGVTAAIKQAEEGGADEERIAELRQYLQYLVQQQAIARGYNPQAMSGTNQSLIASYT